MRSTLAVVSVLFIVASSARGQMAMPGGGRSLGGYGASAISSYYSSGGGGYIPYNGRASGFVPYGGGSLGGSGIPSVPRRLPQTPIGGVMMASTPIGGASLTGGMGTGMGSSMGSRGLVPLGYEGGFGMGGGLTAMPMSRSGAIRRGTPGPGFGYPFRVPPSLTGPSSMSIP